MTGRLVALRREPRRVLAAALVPALAFVLAVVVVGSCSAGPAVAGGPGDGRSPAVVAEHPLRTAVDPPPSSRVLDAAEATQVLADVAAAAAGTGGRVTVVVVAPNGVPLLTAPDATAPAYSASLVKLLVVAGLLARDAGGAVDLAPEDLALMEDALVTSNDAAMNTLWVRYDGARLVTELAAQMGLTGTAPPAVPGQWGQATTTARDVAVLLTSLDEVLGGEDAAAMLGWLRATTGIAADGFHQEFGLLSGVPGPVAAKQGWMCCVDGTRQLHSAGVLADGRVVVLLGLFPAATPRAQASTVLDAAAADVLAGIR